MMSDEEEYQLLELLRCFRPLVLRGAKEALCDAYDAVLERRTRTKCPKVRRGLNEAMIIINQIEARHYSK